MQIQSRKLRVKCLLDGELSENEKRFLVLQFLHPAVDPEDFLLETLLLQINKACICMAKSSEKYKREVP